MAGRRVRSLIGEITGGSAHDLSWKGREDCGRPIVPGIDPVGVATPGLVKSVRAVISG